MKTHNDTERSQWVDNDEGLYNLWRNSKICKRKWIKDNRELIDKVIDNVLGNKKPAHYLAYG